MLLKSSDPTHYFVCETISYLANWITLKPSIYRSDLFAYIDNVLFENYLDVEYSSSCINPIMASFDKYAQLLADRDNGRLKRVEYVFPKNLKRHDRLHDLCQELSCFSLVLVNEEWASLMGSLCNKSCGRRLNCMHPIGWMHALHKNKENLVKKFDRQWSNYWYQKNTKHLRNRVPLHIE